MLLEVFAPGKIILSGEHAVVYGHPALVSSLSFGVEVWISDNEAQLNQTIKAWEDRQIQAGQPFDDLSKLDPTTLAAYSAYLDYVRTLLTSVWQQDLSSLYFRVHSSLSKGLGSSAAVAVALVKGLAEYLSIQITDQEIIRLAREIEHFAHGRSSGVDPAAIVYGGTHLFTHHGREFEHLKIDLAQGWQPQFMLIDSGPVVESTRELVDSVSARSAEFMVNKALFDIGWCAGEMAEALKAGQVTKLREVMQKNHHDLCSLGVVGDQARTQVEKIESVGGVAKISGAGGVKAGSGWLLSYHPDPSKLSELAASEGWVINSLTLGGFKPVIKKN